jgi:hypothetical protein
VKRDNLCECWAQDVIHGAEAVLRAALDDGPEDLASPARRKVILQKIAQLNQLRNFLLTLGEPDLIPEDEETPSERHLH